MTEDEARRFLLVRAVEIEDADAALLTREDRQQAREAALSAGSADNALLAARSAFAFERLRTRYPPLGHAEQAATWPRWLGWALPLGALVVGLLTNELGGGNRLNIIAFPLLGALAWNLLVYILLLAGLLRRFGRAWEPEPSWIERLLARRNSGSGGQPVVKAALARFSVDWLRSGGSLVRSRLRRTLHLAAATLAAGILLGMYWRALGIEYRAGWESTFIGPATLHALLQVVLGPASALTGIGIPSSDQLSALRWSAGPGENAGPWIHLYATTAALVIIAPRLLLAAFAAAGVRRLRRNLPVPGREDFYVRRLLREAHGHGASVRIIPYSFHPATASVQRLHALLTDLYGAGTQLSVDPPIPYGAEDGWLERARFDGEADQLILLFNAAATPEAETHGALAAGIANALKRQRSGAALAAIVDETAHRERLGDQAGADARLQSRRAAWEKVLRQQQLNPISIDFGNSDGTGLARQLEGALVRDAALLAGSAA